jgi:hypothetical protein
MDGQSTKEIDAQNTFVGRMDNIEKMITDTRAIMNNKMGNIDTRLGNIESKIGSVKRLVIELHKEI